MTKIRYDRIPFFAGDPQAATKMYMAGFGGRSNMFGLGNSRWASAGGSSSALAWSINYHFFRRFGLCDWTPICGLGTDLNVFGLVGNYDGGTVDAEIQAKNLNYTGSPGAPFSNMLPGQSRISFKSSATANQSALVMLDPLGVSPDGSMQGKQRKWGSESGLKARVYCQADGDGSGVPEILVRWVERPTETTTLAYNWNTQASGLQHSTGLTLNDSSSAHRKFDTPVSWVVNGVTIPAVMVSGSTGSSKSGPARLSGVRFMRDNNLYKASGFIWQSWSRNNLTASDFIGTHSDYGGALVNFGPWSGAWICYQSNDLLSEAESEISTYNTSLRNLISSIRTAVSDANFPILLVSNYSGTNSSLAYQRLRDQLTYVEAKIAEDLSYVGFINLRRMLDNINLWNSAISTTGGIRPEYAADSQNADPTTQMLIGEVMVQAFLDMATGKGFSWGSPREFLGTLSASP